MSGTIKPEGRECPSPMRLRHPSLAVVLAAAAVLALCMPLFVQKIVNRFLYYPMRYPDGNWAAGQEAGAADRFFRAADGTHLHGWWFAQPRAKFASLFLHGNGGNVTHRIDHAHAAANAGAAFFVVDYRGYGRSEGQPSEHGLYQDADAAYTELQRLGYRPEHIIFHGESLGTAVAVELATRYKCAGLILESPLASLSQMASRVVPVLGPLLAHGFHTQTKITRVHVPVLVMHGDQDEVVPFSQGKAVFRAANQPKEFWQIAGGHHNSLLSAAGLEYVERLRRFMKAL